MPFASLHTHVHTHSHIRNHLRREPLYALAERACWWELHALAAHSHPSVAAMARTLMSGQPVVRVCMCVCLRG